jgi:hypothetical protein
VVKHEEQKVNCKFNVAKHKYSSEHVVKRTKQRIYSLPKKKDLNQTAKVI